VVAINHLLWRRATVEFTRWGMGMNADRIFFLLAVSSRCLRDHSLNHADAPAQRILLSRLKFAAKKRAQDFNTTGTNQQDQTSSSL
jgi:hypothetical protein